MDSAWITPANVAEGGLLRPSLHWCRRHLGWWPGIVVADMGYLSGPSKQAAREGWQSAVVTKLRADMKLVPPYASAARVECPQGQRLEWWEHDPENGQQWFRVPATSEYCAHCWEASGCPRHFGYALGQHETLFGLLPLASRVAQRLLQQVRPWIEPAQSFEKNQLGLGRMFFNSLRLTWQMSLWADSAVLLRTMARLDTPDGSGAAGRLASASVGIGTAAIGFYPLLSAGKCFARKLRTQFVVTTVILSSTMSADYSEWIVFSLRRKAILLIQMNISRITVEGYRSLKKVAWEPAGLNVSV